ncbi:unnamed protein product [Cuscuta epithymum]|uniref:Uncharacterized protein n=1 Tax=Cuscuta epithymum TaxID=186058 RepID=A0AAV0CRI1_9ASTE|nr:unnamed protein product [Cuscuta epithymum]
MSSQWRPPQPNNRNFRHSSPFSNVAAVNAVSPSANPGGFIPGLPCLILPNNFRSFWHLNLMPCQSLLL